MVRIASPSELSSYWNMELRLLPLLAHMDATGVNVDSAALQRNKMVIDPLLKDLEQKAEALVGHPILMWSSKQVCEVLYDELKLEAPKGNRVSTESVLQTSIPGTGDRISPTLEADVHLHRRIRERVR